MTTSEQNKSATELLILKDFEVGLPEEFVTQMKEQQVINIYAPPHQGKNLGAILIAKAIGGSIMAMVDETCSAEDAENAVSDEHDLVTETLLDPSLYDNVLVEGSFYEDLAVLDNIKSNCRLFILHSIEREEMMDDVNVGQIRMSINQGIFFKWRNRETGKVEVIEYDAKRIPPLA